MNKAELVLMDETLSHQVNLLRFNAGERKKILAILDQLQRELKAKLALDLTDFGKARVNKLLSESSAIIDAAYKEMAPAALSSFDIAVKKMPVLLFASFDPLSHKTIADLRALGQHEINLFNEGEESDILNSRQLASIERWVSSLKETKSTDLLGLARTEVQATAKTFVAIGLEAAIPTEAVLRALVSDTLLQGAPLKAWWAKQSDDLAFRYANSIRQGVAQGETLQQIIVRVFGSKRLGTPGIGFPDSILRRNASALVHDSIMSISSAARMAVYKENEDISKGYYHLSTLDGIICPICIARSGAQWDLDFKPIAGNKLPFIQTPVHTNCRCQILPILKSYRELGVDIEEPPTGTRASDLGQIKADTTFDAFLNRHSKEYQNELLGPGRAAMWRKGTITLQDLLNFQGNPLTLKQLSAKYKP